METIITLLMAGLSLIFFFSLLLWRGGEDPSLSSEEVNARLRRMSP